jgi:hypothetical protein
MQFNAAMPPKKWSRFVKEFRETLENKPTDPHDQLNLKISQMICVGLAAVALSYFYKFFPLFARVVVVPIVLIGAWFVGTMIAIIRK